jgi:hypothetical protein
MDDYTKALYTTIGQKDIDIDKISKRNLELLDKVRK